MTGRRVLHIRYPAPLSVLGAVTSAVGMMWPDAVADTSDPSSFTLIIPGTEPGPFTREDADGILAGMGDVEGDGSVDVTGFNGGTLTVSTPKGATQALAEWAHTILSGTDGAVNYVEQEVFDEKSGRRFVVTACWSTGQTPHALRAAAERRAFDAEARAAELEARITELEARVTGTGDGNPAVMPDRSGSAPSTFRTP